VDPEAALVILWVVLGYVGTPVLAIMCLVWAVRQATLAAEDIIATGVAKGKLKSDR
jgi:hypothetical protein